MKYRMEIDMSKLKVAVLFGGQSSELSLIHI